MARPEGPITYNLGMNSISHEAEIKDLNRPFDCDPLKRGACADNLTNLIMNRPTPLVMTVCAPWGQGKTTFIRRWRHQLRTQGFTAIYFNAWENDYVDDPLISFIACLQQYVNADSSLESLTVDAFREIKKYLPAIMTAIPKIALDKMLAGHLQTILDEKEKCLDASDRANRMVADAIDTQMTVSKSIEQFQKLLKTLASTITSNGKPLIVFIDELDRCRPDYAIELLERIKHLFSVQGICFILSVDREIIAHAAAARIGFPESQADGYLRRFIDLDFHLPEPDSAQFLEYCAQKIGLPNEATIALKNYSGAYGLLADYLKLSLRDQLQLMSRLEVVAAAYPSTGTSEFYIVIYYLIFAASDRDLLSDLFKTQHPGYKNIRDITKEAVQWVNVPSKSKGLTDLRDMHESLFPPGLQGASKEQIQQRGKNLKNLGVDDGVGLSELRDLVWQKLQLSLQFQEPVRRQSGERTGSDPTDESSTN
jgi:KAP-like P-loop domain-containing protein